MRKPNSGNGSHSPWRALYGRHRKHVPFRRFYNFRYGRRTNRSSAGHARFADSEGFGSRKDAWNGNLAPHSTDHKWSIPGQARLAVSSPASHGGGGLVKFLLGRGGDQAARQVLPADEIGPAPT